MAADEIILVDVNYDTDEAQNSVVDLTDDIFRLTEANKKLKQQQKDFKGDTEKEIKVRKQLNRQIEANKDAIKRARKERNESLRVKKKELSNFQKLGKQLKSTVTSYLGVAAAIGFVIKGIVNIIKNSAKFEKSLSSLSAITGATGKDLEFFADEAKKTSQQTLQSAADIVKAYELVGSARPELLKNKEALAEVTKQAIILSEATGGKLGLVESAEAVTTVMNQMSLSSGEASKIINVLAAGSKEGAATIPFLTEAFEKAGTSASLMGLSLEEVTGALEANAPFFKEASKLGNSFDKVLLRLKENQIGYKSGVFDLNDAIDELREKYENGTSAADIFGVEHAKLGELLVKNQGEFNEFTEKVTGTTTALEQQQAQNDNLSASWTRLTNTISNGLITNTGALNELVKNTDGAIKVLSNLFLVMKRGSKLTEDQVSDTVDLYSTLNSKSGEVLRKIMQKTTDFSEETFTKNKDAIVEWLASTGFSTKKAEKIYEELLRRRLAQIELDKASAIRAEELKAEEAIKAEEAKNKKISELAEKNRQKERERKRKSDVEQFENDTALALEQEKIFNDEIKEINKQLDEEDKLAQEELDVINAERREKELEMFIAAEQRKKDVVRQILGEIGSLTNQAANLLIASNQNRLDKQLSAIDANAKKQIELAGGNADKITEIEEKAEADKEKIRKAAAKKNQKIQIGNAIIQGALVVLNALLTQPFVPAGLIAAVGAGIAAGLQIATIKQQSFGKGGRVQVAKNGMQMGTFSGASHSGGGVDLFTGTGEHVANVEGKENFYVVNKNASDYINTLSDINQRIGGGIALSNKSRSMQDGGQADINNNQPSIDEITANVIANLPPIIVGVKSIKTGIEQFDEVVEVGVI